MKVFNKKIKQKFLKLIKDNIKKHEYRLANEGNLQIKSGDFLNLISNENNRNYVNVRINNYKKYPNWETALIHNWKNDFKSLYDNFEDCLNDCKKIYSKNDVDKYGIVVWEIEARELKLSNSSILLDTNIIIQRESHNNTSFVVNKLFNWIEKCNNSKYISEETKKELSLYKDEHLKNQILIKLNSYKLLHNFPLCDDDFLNL